MTALPQLASELPIASVVLPPRVYAPLRNADLLTVGQIARTDDHDLLRVPGLGKNLVRQIRDVIPYWADSQPRAERCERCRYWDGMCRHDSPKADSTWPKTKPYDWCGQFAARGSTA